MDDVCAIHWTEEQHYLWVGLLRMFTKYIEKSLLREFFHDGRVLADWRFSLAKLYEATAVWTAWLDGEPDPDALSYFKNRIAEAIFKLDGEESRRDPVDAIYRAMSEVSLARYALNQWQLDSANSKSREKVSAEGPALLASLEGVAFPSREDVWRLLSQQLRAFPDVIRDGNDYATCLVSRLLFHLLYFAATTHYALYRRVRGEAIRLHRHAADTMRPGRARDSLQGRLSCLERLDDAKVFRKALQLVDWTVAISQPVEEAALAHMG